MKLFFYDTGQLSFASDSDSANMTVMESVDSKAKWGGLYLYGGRK